MSPLVAKESDALKFWEDYARCNYGIFWHVRDARGQNVEGMPDVLMVLPKWDGSSVLVALEIKCRRDRLRSAQREAVFALGAVAGSVVGVVRYGKKRDISPLVEMTQDEAVSAIEQALGG